MEDGDNLVVAKDLTDAVFSRGNLLFSVIMADCKPQYPPLTSFRNFGNQLPASNLDTASLAIAIYNGCATGSDSLSLVQSDCRSPRCYEEQKQNCEPEEKPLFLLQSSSPCLSAHLHFCRYRCYNCAAAEDGWGVVQLVARGTLDPEVPGSKPGAPAKNFCLPQADEFGGG